MLTTPIVAPPDGTESDADALLAATRTLALFADENAAPDAVIL